MVHQGIEEGVGTITDTHLTFVCDVDQPFLFIICLKCSTINLIATVALVFTSTLSNVFETALCKPKS